MFGTFQGDETNCHSQSLARVPVSASPTRPIGLPYMPTNWGGAMGVNGAAYVAILWSVWDLDTHLNHPKHPNTI